MEWLNNTLHCLTRANIYEQQSRVNPTNPQHVIDPPRHSVTEIVTHDRRLHLRQLLRLKGDWIIAKLITTTYAEIGTEVRWLWIPRVLTTLNLARLPRGGRCANCIYRIVANNTFGWGLQKINLHRIRPLKGGGGGVRMNCIWNWKRLFV